MVLFFEVAPTFTFTEALFDVGGIQVGSLSGVTSQQVKA